VTAADIATRSDEEIRDAVTRWLRGNLPETWVDAIDEDDSGALATARLALDVDDWWERLGEAGWYFSNWPVEYGGLGLAPEQTARVNDVLRAYKVPRSDNPLGLNVAHALLRWGNAAQKSRFLPPISNQKEIWVQLFSEPGAGSDLAGLSTRAVRDGDLWVINGQKIWSSHAHRAHFGFLLCRTDPDVPKRRGLSVLLLDMSAPGITVRPLRQMTGESRFNEVFFDDVVCNDSMRVGDLGGVADRQPAAHLRTRHRRRWRDGSTRHGDGTQRRRPHPSLWERRRSDHTRANGTRLLLRACSCLDARARPGSPEVGQDKRLRGLAIEAVQQRQRPGAAESFARPRGAERDRPPAGRSLG
jgi:Acyl-CoA dehydrogenase, middle domain/Acyl-CoA dehydrogenase, N-terminal domain